METSKLSLTISKKECDFCHAEEGKPRPVGLFKVKLTPVDVFGTEKLTCQSCAHKHRLIEQSRKAQKRRESRHAIVSNLKKFISKLAHACFLVLLFSSVLMAQPPGLPSPSDQAPIDGGLTILAALGGGYAIKKLRDRRKE